MEHYQKSRGSFVDRKRKSLTLNNIFSDGSEEEVKVEQPKVSMKSYLESLKKEKQEWKDLLKERRLKCRDTENKYKSTPLTITRADVEKFITPEDATFLNNKPDYLGMLQLVRKYIDSVNYLNKYKSDIVDYYGKVCNELEIDKQLLVKEMCAPDLCEICNIKNCKNQEHKFMF